MMNFFNKLKQINIIREIILLLCICCSITSCNALRPYQPVKNQGNEINNADVLKLHLGMTEQQVTQIMQGDTITQTIFQRNNIKQKNYLYTQYKGNKLLQKKILILSFKNNKLINIEKSNNLIKLQK